MNCIFPGTCALINTIAPGASIDFTNTGDFAVVGIGASAIYMRTNFAFQPPDCSSTRCSTPISWSSIPTAPAASRALSMPRRSACAPIAATASAPLQGGPFWEPLATIEVTWADIDNFSQDGNTVTIDDDANVRGRLGIRAGTTMQVWQDPLMEPFVIASLWGNFTDDNPPMVVSNGATFRFEDDLDDVWGEVSAGVNVFNVSANTAVFAKADVTFGDDVTGRRQQGRHARELVGILRCATGLWPT